jgi:hypothetical protein
MSVNTSVNHNNEEDKVKEDVFLTTGYQELTIDKYELIIKDLKEGYRNDIEFLKKHYLVEKNRILNQKTTEIFNLKNQLNQVNGELNQCVEECKEHILTISKLKKKESDIDYAMEPIRKELRNVLEKTKDSWTLFRKYSPKGYKTYLVETYGKYGISVELLRELDREIYSTSHIQSIPVYDTNTYDTNTYDTNTYDTNTIVYNNSMWDNDTGQIRSSKQLSHSPF